MPELINPFLRRVTGEVALGQLPVQLRIEQGTVSRAQVRAAMDVFYAYAERGSHSHVANPTQSGRLPDGSPYRITYVGPAPIFQLWPVQQKSEEGKFKSGFLVSLGSRLDQVFLVPQGKFARPNGRWSQIAVRNWEHQIVSRDYAPYWAHSSLQSKTTDWYVVGGITLGRAGVRQMVMEGGSRLLVDHAPQANGQVRFMGVSNWPDRATFYRSAAVANPITADYKKNRESAPPPLSYVGFSEVSRPFVPGRGEELVALGRNRDGSRIVLTKRTGGGPPLLPFDGGTQAATVQLGFRPALDLALYSVGENWLEPRPVDNNSQLMTDIKAAGSVSVEEYPVLRSNLSLGSPSIIYTAPPSNTQPQPFFIVRNYAGGSSSLVAIEQTYHEVQYQQSVPEVTVVNSDPDNYKAQCHGDTSYQEGCEDESHDVHSVHYMANDERVLIPRKQVLSYAVNAHGRRDMDEQKSNGVYSIADVRSEQMQVDRVERSTLTLPGGRELVERSYEVHEECSASWSKTGPVTHDLTHFNTFEAQSTYSVKALDRTFIVVDPFLELVAYIECNVEYTRTVSANGYYTYDGRNGSYLQGQPFWAQSSGGGGLPEAATPYLVIEFKGRITKYPISWPSEQQWWRRYTGVASVPIPITEPAIVLNGTSNQMGMDGTIWGNRLDRILYLVNQTLVGGVAVTDTRALETGITRPRPTQWRANARGKVLKPLSQFSNLLWTYCKDPLTGAALLWVRSTATPALMSPLMLIIDRKACRPVQSLNPEFPLSRVSEVTEA